MNWAALAERLRKAVSACGGPCKSSDGMLSIHFSHDGGLFVEMGTYSITDWNRHTDIGRFETEEEAFKATEEKIKEAEKIAEDYDDEGNFD